MLTLSLVACLGLENTTTGKDRDGYDLDSGGIPLDTGDPIDSAGDGNHAPVADAGANAEAQVGQLAALDGSASSDEDGDPLDYTWRIVSHPSSSSAALIDAAGADPEFVPDVTGRYEFGLVVSDGAADSPEDTVELTVTEANGGPVANAGPDQTVTVGAAVALDGSSSSDPEGDRLQFAWTLLTRPSGSVATLSSSTSAAPRFTANVTGTYEVTLTVTDGAETSAADSVRIVATEASGGSGGTGGCACRAAPTARLLPWLLLLVPLIRRRARTV